MMDSLPEVVNILAQIKLATAVAMQIGIAVPPALTTFESQAMTVLESVQGFQAPDSLNADFADVAMAAKALSMLASGPTLTGVVTALQNIPAVASDLASGQLAVIGLVGASFSGTDDRVVVAAYRESGPFAKVVDAGTTDTTSING